MTEPSSFANFWERIELYNRKNLIIALFGACDNKPIRSIDHLAAELFLVERCLGIDNGPIITKNLKLSVNKEVRAR